MKGWALSRYSVFLPQPKNMTFSLISFSKLPDYEYVHKWSCVSVKPAFHWTCKRRKTSAKRNMHLIAAVIVNGYESTKR